MLEKLLELAAGGWDRIAPFVIIDAYEGGVVLRLGQYSRTLAPGFHWKWPFLERAVEVNTCVTTMPLAPQTLTTKDDYQVVVACVVKYQIEDPRPFVTDVWDQRDVLADVSMGAVRAAVSEIDYVALIQTPPETRIAELVRREVKRYGFKIHKITFTDIGRVRSLRLITAQRAD